ncbi:hypothetical protein LT493_43930 [Streptomyces tricolor]|nr:hypothetical protein [Streptomyces tricolor]
MPERPAHIDDYNRTVRRIAEETGGGTLVFFVDMAPRSTPRRRAATTSPTSSPHDQGYAKDGGRPAGRPPRPAAPPPRPGRSSPATRAPCTDPMALGRRPAGPRQLLPATSRVGRTKG